MVSGGLLSPSELNRRSVSQTLSAFVQSKYRRFRLMTAPPSARMVRFLARTISLGSFGFFGSMFGSMFVLITISIPRPSALLALSMASARVPEPLFFPLVTSIRSGFLPPPVTFCPNPIALIPLVLGKQFRNTAPLRGRTRGERAKPRSDPGLWSSGGAAVLQEPRHRGFPLRPVGGAVLVAESRGADRCLPLDAEGNVEDLKLEICLRVLHIEPLENDVGVFRFTRGGEWNPGRPRARLGRVKVENHTRAAQQYFPGHGILLDDLPDCLLVLFDYLIGL